VIRTAHAVRSIARAPGGEDEPWRRELAHGLGYWAARYSARDAEASRDAAPSGDPAEAALSALDDLVADACGFYVATPIGHPVPLAHAITGPASVRLVLPHLPADQQWASFLAARDCSLGLRAYYAGGARTAEQRPDSATHATLPTADQIVADAVELGDEHAIKVAEVAVRHEAIRPDARHLAAAHAANQRLRGFLSSHSFYD
jgi:hypothetical protein